MMLKQSQSPRNARCHAAFSIVEATVGMGLLGMIVVVLSSGFITGFFTMKMIRENLRATQIMLEKMETIRLYSWDQVNTPGFIPTNFVAYYDPTAAVGNQGAAYTGTMTLTAAPFWASYQDDMKSVTVTVNWTTGGLNRSRSFTSYIARNGLQSYIY